MDSVHLETLRHISDTASCAATILQRHFIQAETTGEALLEPLEVGGLLSAMIVAGNSLANLVDHQKRRA